MFQSTGNNRHFLKTLLSQTKQILELGLNDLMPPTCLNCHKEISQPQSICKTCWEDIQFITTPICQSCGYEFENKAGISSQSLCPACIAQKPKFEMARAAVSYNDQSRSLLMKFKHGDQQHIAPLFNHWLEMAKHQFPMNTEFDYVAPVPLHRHRLLKRRYNQAALLAKNFSKQHQLAYTPNLLLRVKPTQSQGHLSLKARRRNLRNAFEVNKNYLHQLAGKSILLIDDVYTTGSTVEEASRILKRHGISNVYVLTVARVSRPQKVD